MESHAWVITKPSLGKYTTDCLRLETYRIPQLGAGEALLRTIYLSLDPSNRNSLTRQPNTSPVPLKVGDIMMGQAISLVVDSAADGLIKGNLVAGMTGWETYSIVSADRVRKVKPDVPLETNLTIFSHIGYAAAAGIIGIGEATPADTIAVSAAAGATGSLAAQLGKAIGARVIGIAGGPEKCRHLTDELGLDGAIDYKFEDMDAALKRLCPQGVSLFFDNVGGPILDAVLMNLAVGARIAVCGQIALYNSADRNDGQGVRNLMQLVFRSASMRGFFAGQPAERMPEYEATLTRLYREGKLKARAHIIKGLEHAPEGLDLILSGKNEGKLMVEVSPVP
jgi:NADPH-dependent curcumin reductase CurA